jgi:hypothetical protein
MLPTSFRFIWPSSFRGKDFFNISQSETRVALGGHICWRNGTATRFSGGRSRSTRREPPTMGKQLVNFIGCESSAPFFVIYKVFTFNNWGIDSQAHFSSWIRLFPNEGKKKKNPIEHTFFLRSVFLFSNLLNLVLNFFMVECFFTVWYILTGIEARLNMFEPC